MWRLQRWSLFIKVWRRVQRLQGKTVSLLPAEAFISLSDARFRCKKVPKRRCKTLYEHRCSTKKKCHTVDEQECTSIPQKECKNVKQCQTKYREECKPDYSYGHSCQSVPYEVWPPTGQWPLTIIPVYHLQDCQTGNKCRMVYRPSCQSVPRQKCRDVKQCYKKPLERCWTAYLNKCRNVCM